MPDYACTMSEFPFSFSTTLSLSSSDESLSPLLSSTQIPCLFASFLPLSISARRDILVRTFVEPLQICNLKCEMSVARNIFESSRREGDPAIIGNELRTARFAACFTAAHAIPPPRHDLRRRFAGIVQDVARRRDNF